MDGHHLGGDESRNIRSPDWAMLRNPAISAKPTRSGIAHQVSEAGAIPGHPHPEPPPRRRKVCAKSAVRNDAFASSETPRNAFLRDEREGISGDGGLLVVQDPESIAEKGDFG